MIGARRNQFKKIVSSVESSGGTDRRNTESNASGTYQFLPSTIRRLQAKYPERLAKYAQMDPAAVALHMQANADPAMEEEFYDTLVDDQRQTIEGWGGDPDDPVAHMLMHRQPTVAKEYIKAGGGEKGFAAVKDIKFSDKYGETAGMYLNKYKKAAAASGSDLFETKKTLPPTPIGDRKTFGERATPPPISTPVTPKLGPKVAPPQEKAMTTQDTQSKSAGGGTSGAALRGFMKMLGAYIESQKPQAAPQAAPAAQGAKYPEGARPGGTPMGTQQSLNAGQALAANTPDRNSPTGWAAAQLPPPALGPSGPESGPVGPGYVPPYSGETEVGPSSVPGGTGRLGPAQIPMPMETSTGASVYPGSAQGASGGEAIPYYIAAPNDYVTRMPPGYQAPPAGGGDFAGQLGAPLPGTEKSATGYPQDGKQPKPGFWGRVMNTLLPQQPYGYERGRRDFSAGEQQMYQQNVPGFENLSPKQQRKYDKATDKLTEAMTYGKGVDKPRKLDRAMKRKRYLEMLAEQSRDGDLTQQEKMDAYKEVYPKKAKWRLGPFFGPDFRGEI